MKAEGSPEQEGRDDGTRFYKTDLYVYARRRPPEAKLVSIFGPYIREQTQTGNVVWKTPNPAFSWEVDSDEPSHLDAPKEDVEQAWSTLRITMMAGYHAGDVIDHFFLGTSHEAMDDIFRQGKLTNPTGTFMGRALRRDSFSAEKGSLRISYTEKSIFSYGMELARKGRHRDGTTLLIVNGDGGPTRHTRSHQAELRSHLEELVSNDRGTANDVKTLLPHAIIPFSVLAAARISPMCSPAASPPCRRI
jgi:hypothetical protein